MMCCRRLELGGRDEFCLWRAAQVVDATRAQPRHRGEEGGSRVTCEREHPEA